MLDVLNLVFLSELPTFRHILEVTFDRNRVKFLLLFIFIVEHETVFLSFVFLYSHELSMKRAPK